MEGHGGLCRRQRSAAGAVYALWFGAFEGQGMGGGIEHGGALSFSFLNLKREKKKNIVKIRNFANTCARPPAANSPPSVTV